MSFTREGTRAANGRSGGDAEPVPTTAPGSPAPPAPGPPLSTPLISFRRVPGLIARDLNDDAFREHVAGFASTLFVATDTFHWRSGQEHVRRYALPAPRTSAADFCGDCGSAVPLVVAGSPFAMLPAGAIDTPLPKLPAAHLYVGSKAAWCEIGDAGEEFAELPPPERFAEVFG